MTTVRSQAIGRTIQLFLVDGAPTGLRIASIHGWTGSVLVANQSTFDRLRARPEAARTGVYILFGPDPEDGLRMRAYIGEAESVKDRINKSAEEREFWETAAIVTTSDEALNKGHVRYLEARLIEIAASAGRVILDNSQSPNVDRKRLPEADRANMEAFLANLEVILPVVGFDLLKRRATPSADGTGKGPDSDSAQFEIRHRSGVQATGVEIDNEFVVLAGSQALKDSGNQGNKSYEHLRQDLITRGVLTTTESDDVYTFAKDYAFKSPSASASVILDRNSNGRWQWRVVGRDLTYHQWQEQKTEQEEAAA